MTPDVWAVIGVGVVLLGAILTQGASLRAEIRALRGRIDHLADELRALSERVAKLEGLLEGSRLAEMLRSESKPKP